MDPIVTPMLAALGLLNSFMGQSSANSLAQSNLQYQKQRDQEAQHMSQAARTDSYGNKQYYDPATNTWKTELTPMQKAIQTAGETEQYRGMTEDAQRNRDLRKRQATMSEDAVVPYNDAVERFTNLQPKSEQSINDRLQTLMIQADADRGKTNQADLIKQSLRMGKGANIPAIVKSTDDNLGASGSSAMLRAAEGARTQHQGDVQAHNSEFLPVIGKFQEIINNGGGGAAQRFSDVPAQMAAMQGNQASGMLQALTSGSSALNNASRTATAAAGKQVDFNPLIKALGAYGKGSEDRWDKAPKKVDYSTVPDYLGDIEYGRRDSQGEYF